MSEPLEVIYIVSVDAKRALISNEQSVVDLMNFNETISISSGKLQFQPEEGKLVLAGFKASVMVTDTITEKMFTVSLLIPIDTEYILVEALLKEARQMLHRIDPETAKIVVTKNEVLANYGIKAYPIILKVENNFRDFISRFMLMKLGGDWFNTSVPTEVSQKRRKEEERNLNPYSEVYGLDFIDLAKVLMKPYSTINLEQAQTILRQNKLNNDQQIAQLKGLVPLSNYERYFQKEIKIESKKFDKTWAKLYSLRNQVAHNRGLTFTSFRTLERLAHDANIVIEQLKKHVPDIKMSKEEKKQTASIAMDDIDYLSSFLDDVTDENIKSIVEMADYLADDEQERQADTLADHLFFDVEEADHQAEAYLTGLADYLEPDYDSEDMEFAEHLIDELEQSTVDFYEAIGRPYRVTDNEALPVQSTSDSKINEEP